MTTANHPPTIAQQPLSQSVLASGTATFVVVESSGDAGLQWRKNAVEISGAKDGSYTTPPVSLNDSGTVFDCEVTNDSGSILTNAVVLLVVAASNAPAPSPAPAPAPVTAPTISQQPTAQSVTAPATAVFTLVATTGGGNLAYKWRKTVGGTTTPITGATSATYTTPATSTGDNGATFDCVVSNSAGSVTSAAVSLTVAAQGSADTRPRFGVGSSTAGASTPAALLAAMTPTGSNGSKAATFTITPTTGQYGWFACVASASTGGVTFSGPDGTGGWQGASSSGNNGADDGSSPNTSTLTYSDGTTTWRFFRQSFSAAAGTFTTS